MDASHTVSAQFARLMLRVAEQEGMDPEEVCRAAALRLPAEDGVEARIPIGAHQRLWDVLMARTGDARLPFDIATRIQTAPHSVIELMGMTSPSLGEALTRVIRFLALYTPSSRWEMTSEGRLTRLTYSLTTAPSSSDTYRTEYAVAYLMRAAYRFTAEPWAPRVVRFAHARPDGARRVDEYFRSEVQFGGERTEVELDTELLSLPMCKSDLALINFFDHHAQRLLQGLGSRTSDDILQQAKHALQAKLTGGAPSLSAVAAQLGMSARTLRRRLEERDTTYQALLASVRCSLAKRHLENGALSQTEIAFSLGFSDVSAFHRAFRKWTGLTPRQYQHGPDPSSVSRL